MSLEYFENPNPQVREQTIIHRIAEMGAEDFQSKESVFALFRELIVESLESQISEQKRAIKKYADAMYEADPDATLEQWLNVDPEIIRRGREKRGYFLKPGESGGAVIQTAGEVKDDGQIDTDVLAVNRFHMAKKYEMHIRGQELAERNLENIKEWTLEKQSIHLAHILRSEYLAVQSSIIVSESKSANVDTLQRTQERLNKSIRLLVPDDMADFMLTFPSTLSGIQTVREAGGIIFTGYQDLTDGEKREKKIVPPIFSSTANRYSN